jgi:hypothetical protein
MLSNKQLATKYHCSERTIRNWKLAGAPVQDPAAMKNWLASRKHVPPGLALAGHGPKNSPARPVAHRPAQGDGPTTGLSATLGRLEQAEFQAWLRVQAALDAGDALASKIAHDNWLRLTKEIRPFEKMLSATERAAGVWIRRSECERLLSFAGALINFVLEEQLAPVALALAGATDLPGARIVLRKLFLTTESLALGATFSQNMGFPAWASMAMASAHCANSNESPENLKRIGECLNEAMKKFTAKIIEQNPLWTNPAGPPPPDGPTEPTAPGPETPSSTIAN